MVHENLDVNSDQVTNLAEPYQYAAGGFRDLSSRIDEIAARYRDAWGHDSIGAQVAPAFEQGFQYLQGSAKALHQTLSFYSDGLGQSGKVYGESEDNAAEGGRQLDSAFSQLQTPTFRTPEDPSSPGTPFKTARRFAVEDEAEPEESTPRLLMRSERRVAEPLEPAVPLQRAEEPTRFLAAERVEGEPLQPLMRGERIAEEPAQPLMRAERIEAQPAQPAVPEGAVIDPSIPPDAYGPWYRLPDGTVLAHPTESARIPVTPTDT